MEARSALLIVDVQNDFCPGGALQVTDGDRVVAPVNRAAERFAAAGKPVLATRDWHPPQTQHFREFGGSWPKHCVQGTPGADFHPDLRLPQGTLVLSKGSSPKQDGYSAFDGVDEAGRALKTVLLELGVRQLYLAGLATDYCILFTAREALKNGFQVFVLIDAVAGVDVIPGDAERALEELADIGVRLLKVEALESST